MSENTFNPWKHFNNYNEQIFADKSSDLPQWAHQALEGSCHIPFFPPSWKQSSPIMRSPV